MVDIVKDIKGWGGKAKVKFTASSIITLKTDIALLVPANPVSRSVFFSVFSY